MDAELLKKIKKGETVKGEKGGCVYSVSRADIIKVSFSGPQERREALENEFKKYLGDPIGFKISADNDLFIWPPNLPAPPAVSKKIVDRLKQIF